MLAIAALLVVTRIQYKTATATSVGRQEGDLKGTNHSNGIRTRCRHRWGPNESPHLAEDLS